MSLFKTYWKFFYLDFFNFLFFKNKRGTNLKCFKKKKKIGTAVLKRAASYCKLEWVFHLNLYRLNNLYRN